MVTFAVVALLGLTALAALLLAALLVINWWHRRRDARLARLRLDDLMHAEHHRDIVRRFGRFPHRNVILGRESTAEELHYLENGGYQG